LCGKYVFAYLYTYVHVYIYTEITVRNPLLTKCTSHLDSFSEVYAVNWNLDKWRG